MRLSTSIVVQGHSSSTKTTTRIETSSNETRSLVHLRSTTSSIRLEEPSAPSHEFSKGETRRLALPLTSYTKRTDTLTQVSSALGTRRSVTIGTTVQCSDSKTKMAVKPTHAETRSLIQHRVVTSGGRSEALMATMFAKSGSSGLLETVTTLQDSRTGVRQLCHGRHIGDRSHVMEKCRNDYTGEVFENLDLVNLSSDEVAQFDDEWKVKVTGKN
ncbi:hypothetical protein HPB47_012783 [Ixodes persulcatus]|uniref:Uncharacterized protein n=1 Tax=Ixodes persulcatus TaxID=34615 RepID=A0AC60NSS1_IXOPE|nr:hypothetical protein HPB47_012783 [Ixodes persulcatus]